GLASPGDGTGLDRTRSRGLGIGPSFVAGDAGDVAGIAGLRFGLVAGHDQQDLSGRGGSTGSVDSALGVVFGEVHCVLRQSGLVRAGPLAACMDIGLGRVVLRVVGGRESVFTAADWDLYGGLIRLLHGVPRRTVSAQTTPALPDLLLSDAGGGRGF